MEFEAVIGLEVHAQLNTDTKIFCGCSPGFGAEPNSRTCPVCQGHPGVLPVFNRAVLDKTVKTGLAVEGEIARFSTFDRKNYFYPDLPKAYQISQFYHPIVNGGKIAVTDSAGNEKSFRINHIHMEEDAGKLNHPDDNSDFHSYVDLNRCGTPLIEIVSEPDMHSAEDAFLYLTELKAILEYIDVSDCNMEEGSLRCDVNVSVKPVEQKEPGTRAEIKNMNSFHNIQKAIEYEIKRQIEEIQSGGKVIQETRLFDAGKGITRSLRSKEEAHDYRYFPDPDLVPVTLTDEEIEATKETLPELPGSRKIRFVNAYGITARDAQTLCASRALADYYEEAVASYPDQPKKIANWIQTEVMRALNENGTAISDFLVPPKQIGEIFKLIDENVISGKIAKEVFGYMVSERKAPSIIVEERSLKQMTDSGEIEAVIDEILQNNQPQVQQYRDGKQNLLGFFVGQVMKASRGKANPQTVNELLRKKLQG